MASEISQIPLTRIDQTSTNLASYHGKVLLVVNVASQCGLTPQYSGLEKIYETYQSKGFEVLGFPANEFGSQEPGTDSDIKTFCESKFGVKFPMFSKVVVKGEGQHPLFQKLTQAQPQAFHKPDSVLKQRLQEKGLLTGAPNDITWNFEKFLISKSGKVVARFAPDISPEDPALLKAIETELAHP